MKYECPSCYLEWKDSKPPLDTKKYPLCSFCPIKHTEKELLNWQMEHLENINSEKRVKVIRRFYRFVELEMKVLKEKFYDHIDTEMPTNSKESKQI